MANYDEPSANRNQAKPMSDDDLVGFAMPTSPSSRHIEALVPREPWTALIFGVCLGIVIGKLLR
jgi:hypothetical protein